MLSPLDLFPEELRAFATTLLIIIVALVLILPRWKNRPSTASFPYVAHPVLLSPAEFAFLKVLDHAVDDGHRVFAKVRLADIVKVKSMPDRSAWARAFNQISAKHVDYVVCDRNSSQILYAVELDDRSHNRRDRRERDEFVNQAFVSAGIPLVHIRTAGTYTVEEVASHLPRATETCL